MKAALPKLFSLVVVLTLLVPVGAVAAPAGSVSDVAPAVASNGPSVGGNPVVTDDAPSSPAPRQKLVIDPNKIVRLLVQLEDAPWLLTRAASLD